MTGRILVTGGAGYIGSVVVERLVAEGHEVVVIDNLANGHPAAVHPDAKFLRGDILDRDWLLSCMQQERVDAVVHLAAEALIDESIRDPGRFFRANVVGGINLLDGMVASGVRDMVFSSTAAVYGEPEATPIVETARKVPVNAYGESKLAFERTLPWYARSHGIRHVSLRYFNACGATERYGEDREVETHLIPVALGVAAGAAPEFRVYGTDYATPDGSCLRDYVHVSDIASAHVLALQNMERVTGRAYNLGNGSGYSNLQVIDAVQRVTGREFAVHAAPRRPGDPERLVASSDLIRRDLGWTPQFPDLESMIESAWRWRLAHPNGYRQ